MRFDRLPVYILAVFTVAFVAVLLTRTAHGGRGGRTWPRPIECSPPLCAEQPDTAPADDVRELLDTVKEPPADSVDSLLPARGRALI